MPNCAFHTYVPGSDGKFGYGGKCFPKDVNAAQGESRKNLFVIPSQSSEDKVNASAKMTDGTPLGTLLEHLYEQNVHFRGFEEHI